MVVGEKVVKAPVLDRSSNPPNSGRISSKLVLRVDDADLHERQSARDRLLPPSSSSYPKEAFQEVGQVQRGLEVQMGLRLVWKAPSKYSRGREL